MEAYLNSAPIEITQPQDSSGMKKDERRIEGKRDKIWFKQKKSSTIVVRVDGLIKQRNKIISKLFFK
jgi:hypothetical protein